MQWYTLYDSTGKILSSFTAQTETFAILNKREGTEIVAGEYIPETGYIDTTTKQFITFPEKPSPNFKFNYNTKQWEDPRTLAELKIEKWEQIKSVREQKEYGGFLWNNYRFDSDPAAQSRIQGAIQLANLTPGSFSIDWTLADNSIITLNAQQLLEVGQVLGQHVIQQHTIARQLRNSIEQAVNSEQLNQVTWPNS